MSDVPFGDEGQPGLAGPDPTTLPQASGIRRSVVLAGGVLLGVIVVGFVLFGGRVVREFGPQATLPSVDAAIPTGATRAHDPLKSVQTDYSRLLEKPLPPPQPLVPAFAPGLPPEPVPQARPPAPPPPQGYAGHESRQPRERGVLVIQGGTPRQVQAGNQPPITPGYAQAAADQPGAPVAEARKMTSKEGFREQASGRIPETMQDRLHAPASPYAVLAGDLIPASLIPGIHSDLPNEISAQVSLHVRDSVTGAYVLIPQGSRLKGIYDSVVVHGQDRVLIAWQRLRLPNGDSIQLEGAPGVDVAGYAGLKDKVDTHFWSVLRAVLMSSILSIGARVPFGDTEGEWPTMGQQFASEFSRGVNQAGQRIVDRELSRPTTIKIRPGMRFNVLVHRDMVLQPWDTVLGTYAQRKD